MFFTKNILLITYISINLISSLIPLQNIGF